MCWGLRSGEVSGCDVQLCASLSICVCPSVAPPLAVCVGQGCAGGVCLAFKPGLCF